MVIMNVISAISGFHNRYIYVSIDFHVIRGSLAVSCALMCATVRKYISTEHDT